MLHGRVPLFALALTLAATGCVPPCGQVCRKVLFTCDLNSERVAFDECEASCTQQLELYRQWRDDELLDLFDDHRRCIAHSSCDEIAAGQCYDGYEALFVFDPSKELADPDPGTSPTE
ncbi:MAG: hypothetical protein R3F59_36465 [Myxococcota bacterium]